MKHFTKAEFQGWFDVMDKELLEKLDELREKLGSPISISPAEGAVGRRLGPDRRSYHNLDYHGVVKAVDVMPATDNIQRAFRLAKAVGFCGIGIYVDTKPRKMLHLDVRPKQFKRRWFAYFDMHTNKREYVFL